jgi:tetratricopeptide (TPR) repeat protein
MSSDEIDVLVDESSANFGVFRNGNKLNDFEVPAKALKKVLKLPSYIRNLENPINSHDLCKARMYFLNRSKHLVNDQASLIKKVILQGRNLISKKRFLKAVEVLEKTVHEGICHSDIFYLLGESFRLLNENEQAEMWIQRSMQMKIHPPQCYFSMGLICQNMNKFQDSVNFLQEYLQRLDDLSGHYELGRSFMKMGLFDEAIEEFTYFISLKRPNLDPAVLLLRAEAFEALDNFDMARKDYRLVLKINPNFYAPYLEHAQELAACGKFLESRTIVEFVRVRTRLGPEKYLD